jgi:hypothetical protein
VAVDPTALLPLCAQPPPFHTRATTGWWRVLSEFPVAPKLGPLFRELLKHLGVRKRAEWKANEKRVFQASGQPAMAAATKSMQAVWRAHAPASLSCALHASVAPAHPPARACECFK